MSDEQKDEREGKTGGLSGEAADVEAHSKSTYPKDSAPKEDDDAGDDDVEAHFKSSRLGG